MRLIYRKQLFPFFYIFIYLIFFFIMQISVEMEALDIWRYYASAKQNAKIYCNLFDIVKYSLDNSFDFIYTVSLWMACRLNISMNFVTAFYLSLYYLLSYNIVKKHFSNTFIPNYVIAYALMFAPFIWVQEISRNLAAIAILYVAINFFLNKKYVKALLFLVISVFTHISILIYVPIFIAAHFLSGVQIKSHYILVCILGLVICSLVTPSFLVDLISSYAAGTDSRYAYYGDEMEYVGVFNSTGIGYGDKLPILFAFVFSIILLIVNKKRDFMFWCHFILTSMLSFFLFSSLMFTNRIIMLLTLIIVWNTVQVYVTSSKNIRKIVRYLSVIGCICVLLHFWSYRTAFLNF